LQGAPDIVLDVVPFDALALWRPPTIAVTTGTDTATFTYRDDAGHLHTEAVDRASGERLLPERRRPATAADEPHRTSSARRFVRIGDGADHRYVRGSLSVVTTDAIPGCRSRRSHGCD
jgi:hypothetical protein